MPWYRMHGTMVHLKLSGKAKKNPPAPCSGRIPLPGFGNTSAGEQVRCCALSSYLCDWPVDGGTCDAPLCPEHAHQVGPDRHLCPIHAERQRAAEPELF